MKKFKNIFYVILALYLVATIIFITNTDAMFDRFGIYSFISFLQVWVFIGLFLLVAEVIIENLHIRKLQHKIKVLNDELTKTKIKFYDREVEREENDKSMKSFESTLKHKKDDDTSYPPS
ncbi:hypothetical protein BH23BAC1_BH23BAC1_21730 [soil metagenome]|jgi:cell shape-determining protein MreC